MSENDPAMSAADPAITDPASEPTRPAAEPRAAPDILARLRLLGGLLAAGFVVLAVALFLVWRLPRSPAALRQAEATIGALQQQVSGMQEQVEGVAAQRSDLQQALQKADARIAALQARPVPDIAPLQAEIASLRAQIPAAATAAGTSALATRLDALSGRLDALSSAERDAETRLDAALAIEARTRAQAVQALAARVQGENAALRDNAASAQRAATAAATVADKAALLGRVQAAEAALAAGRPLGTLTGAPPAVARYADAAPPTAASLRLAFPAVAARALAASRPDTEGRPFLQRIWIRMQQQVVVRAGDKVLIGNPEAGTLARARAAVDAGDLRAAVSLLDGLHGLSARVVAPWLAEARDLLAAQDALGAMQGGA